MLRIYEEARFWSLGCFSYPRNSIANLGGNEAKNLSECLLLKWSLGVKFPDPMESSEREGVHVLL